MERNMDYKAVSQQVVDNVGGLENIEGAPRIA